MQNMFPVTNEYVESQYIKNNIPIYVIYLRQKDLIKH